jgi:hypothetical protein
VENLLEYAVFHVVSQEVQEKEIGGRQLPKEVPTSPQLTVFQEYRINSFF